MLRRVINRYNHEVNGYFLCDRGRFGYEFVNSDERIHECLVDGEPADLASADLTASRRRCRTEIALASDRRARRLRATSLFGSLVGPDRFYAGVADDEWRVTLAALEVLQNGPAQVAVSG